MSVSEAQAAAAIVVLERMINAARNGNQAGEDAVVAAVAWPELLALAQEVALLDDLRRFTNGPIADQARAAIAKATAA